MHHASIPTPSRAVHRWQAPATCGELLQGALDGEDFMVNCPIDLFATAHAVATQETGVDVQDAHAYGKVVATLQNLASRAAATPGRAPGGVSLQLDSPIPRGKGMASSTADASCALSAVAACLKLKIDEAEAARLLTAVEPSDCTHFRGIAQLNFLSGSLIDRLPAPSGLHVLVVDCGGEVETLHFDRERARSVYARHSERLRSALLELKRGLCTGCNRSVGRAATKSTELSQLILPKRAFPELRALAPAWGVLGINCAHSGTVLGLLYEPDPGREQLLRERLARSFGPELQVLGSFRIIGGGNRVV